MDDKRALVGSSAGIRLIALLTVYNGSAPDRLRQFIDDSYHESLLDVVSAQTRFEQFMRLREALGKLRVRQVIGTSKLVVVALLNSECGGDVFVEVRVGEDYPHLVTDISVTPLAIGKGGADADRS